MVFGNTNCPNFEPWWALISQFWEKNSYYRNEEKYIDGLGVSLKSFCKSTYQTVPKFKTTKTSSFIGTLQGKITNQQKIPPFSLFPRQKLVQLFMGHVLFKFTYICSNGTTCALNSPATRYIFFTWYTYLFLLRTGTGNFSSNFALF